MAHTHGLRTEDGTPIKSGCKLTKDQCDERWTQFLHGHIGTPCKREVKPGNVKETCVIEGVRRPGLSFEGELARQLAAGAGLEPATLRVTTAGSTD